MTTVGSIMNDMRDKIEKLEAENQKLREALRRLMLCDIGEVRTIEGSSGAMASARAALAKEE